MSIIFKDNVEVEKLLNLSDFLVSNIKKKNIQGEVSILVRNEISTIVRLGKIENVECNTNKLVNLTIYNNLKKGIASSTSFSKSSLTKMIDAAFNISEYSQKDIYNGLPSKNLMAINFPKLQTYNWKKIDIKNLIHIAKTCEHEGLSYDKKIVNSEGVNFSVVYSCKIYANTNGFVFYNLFSKYFLSCILISSENNKMERDFDYTVARNFDYLNISNISKNAAKFAIKRLNSKRIKTTRCPIILTSSIAGSLLSSLVAAISGRNIYRKNSFLLDSINKQIFPSFISIKENPYIISGLGSSSFDCEGVATKSKYIVEKGYLKTYLLDTYSAKKLNTKTTGNCGGVYNLILESTKIDNFDNIVKIMNDGLIITELLGYGTNIINGDYSRGAVGYLVKNGKIQHSVSEITISGNLKNIYNNIQYIANDTDIRNNIITGSILIDDMIIGGE